MPSLNWTAVLSALHRRLRKRSLRYYKGRNRNTYVMPHGYVVKVPIQIGGYGDNDWEGSVSNSEESLDNEYCVQYPKTRLIYYHTIPIVLMEYIQDASYTEIESRLGKIPDWVNSVDGGQVGFNKHGRLVAYDYGLN